MSLDLNQIYAARATLQGISQVTPTLRDDVLSKEWGVNLYLKAECLQKSGSFKLRGAYVKIKGLTALEAARGVIAASAGNHAQGVALAAQLRGIRAVIVMPIFAPLTKVMATRAYGAEVILYGQSFDDAAAHAQTLALERGYVMVHAFNDFAIMAGQGTAGLELLEAVPELNTLVVPIGGGGLISGMTTAIKALKPDVRVIGVQAAGCSSVIPSLEQGHPIQVSAAQTIADGIAVKRPGDLTLPIIRELVDDVLEVTDDEIARAIVHCSLSSKLVVEGAGAAGLAALMAGKVALEPGENVATILCGGNIDGNLLSRVIEQVMTRQGRYILLRLTIVDRPGALAPLLERISETQANVMDIFHQRAAWLAPLGKVGVELLLEVRNAEHGLEVVSNLLSAGYGVERVEQGHWPE